MIRQMRRGHNFTLIQRFHLQISYTNFKSSFTFIRKTVVYTIFQQLTYHLHSSVRSLSLSAVWFACHGNVGMESIYKCSSGGVIWQCAIFCSLVLISIHIFLKYKVFQLSASGYAVRWPPYLANLVQWHTPCMQNSTFCLCQPSLCHSL